MRHDVQPVEESVGPDRNSAKRNSDGGVVDKELIIHHLELGVAADPEERSPNTDHGSIRDVGEPFDDQPVTGHLGKPVIVGTLGPVLGVVLPGDGENGHLVTEPVVILNQPKLKRKQRSEYIKMGRKLFGQLTRAPFND